MKEDGVIDVSDSLWTSPIDFHQLNVTNKNRFLLSRINNSLDTLVGFKIYSALNLKIGYWQVELEPKAWEKIAFTIAKSLWPFTGLPFKLYKPLLSKDLLHKWK